MHGGKVRGRPSPTGRLFRAGPDAIGMNGEAPAGISIREATPDDRVAVARVLDGALLDVEALGSQVADGHVLAATTGEVIVGAVVVAPDGPSKRSPPSGWPEAAHLRAVAVRRKRRRDRIGSALVRAARRRWSPVVADFEADVRPFYETLDADCEESADGRHWALL